MMSNEQIKEGDNELNKTSHERSFIDTTNQLVDYFEKIYNHITFILESVAGRISFLIFA